MDFGKILYFYTISVKAMRMNLQSYGSESVLKSCGWCKVHVYQIISSRKECSC